LNVVVFAITAWLVVAFNVGLAGLWRLGDVAPNLVLVLMCFIALSAPPATAMWCAILLGLCVDLQPYPPGEGVRDVIVLGPWALSFAFAAYAILRLRQLAIRESVLTLITVVLLLGLVAQLLAGALLAIRGLPFLPGETPPGFSLADFLVGGFLEVVYSTVIAWPLGVLLGWTRPWWSFQDPTVVGGRARRTL